MAQGDHSTDGSGTRGERTNLPPGRPADELLEEVRAERAHDLDWRGGRAFSLVYHTDDPELEQLQHEIASMFLHENALNPFRYRTLLRMEQELIEMARGLLGASHATLSSGGTESIFLAVQTARDHHRAHGGESPVLLCSETAHPAFAKACHYLGVERRPLPVREDGRADPDAYAAAIDRHTALVVVSAPSYPFGVIDPVEEVAAIAAERGVLCHVDACLGGYLLPYWERLGQPVPPWDFRVEGVTSMSADLHKYGYAFKGVSTVLYRDRELYEHQIFMYDSWPGGLYASASSAGTRPGAPIAGAWATMRHLGDDGYLRLASRVLDATTTFMDGVRSIDGLRITSDPDMSVFEFGPDPDSEVRVDIEAVGDVMDDRGWNLDRQQGGLHVMASPGHDKVADAFVADLRDAVADHGTARGGAHVYGGVVDAGG
ncbi:MAG TPA: aspartate aminotransferase family protein [Microthrixaceae bacterium]|nr:aspartate aminotransferase family protein [Microthrixaceae bacterium]